MNDRFYPYIPETITVHLGRPSRPAENVSVSFLDYMKNVASSEVYPTWEEEALKANILAQASFALNRVYLEYYRSRGYDFDITSSTAYDQQFTQGREIFENVGYLVEALFGSYIRRVGTIEPLAASFCNGTTVTCSGLSQWGSQALAQQGYSALEILKYYYGDDIEIVTDAPVRTVSSIYPGTPLRLGSAGADVLLVQYALNRIGRNYPAIPKISPLDGLFGPGTESAVQTFQKIFNLSPDGVVGPATWYQIVNIYVAVTKLAELESEGQRYLFDSFEIPQVLSLGSSGENVSRLQYLLNVLSGFIPEVPSVQIDSQYGIATRDAVLAYQRFAGLTPSGLVGSATWDSMLARYAGITGTVFDDPVLFPQETVPAVRTISQVQQALRAAEPVYAPLPAPAVTGVMDRATARALVRLQNRLKLHPSGLPDAETLKCLELLWCNTRLVPRFRQYPGHVLYPGQKDQCGKEHVYG